MYIKFTRLYYESSLTKKKDPQSGNLEDYKTLETCGAFPCWNSF